MKKIVLLLAALFCVGTQTFAQDQYEDSKILSNKENKSIKNGSENIQDKELLDYKTVYLSSGEEYTWKYKDVGSLWYNYEVATSSNNKLKLYVYTQGQGPAGLTAETKILKSGFDPAGTFSKLTGINDLYIEVTNLGSSSTKVIMKFYRY